MKTDAILRDVNRTVCTTWQWCDGHRKAPIGLHQHHLPGRWRDRNGGPEVGVALEVHDEDDQDPNLVISLSLDGEIVDVGVSLSLGHAESYALAVLAAVAKARAGHVRSDIA